ncbi:MAG TPA: hypothetical protein VK856_08570, partial [Anaerolineaceae bacterium]|nr:hypothetical protein [Anaerolineaceae bacterium]
MIILASSIGNLEFRPGLPIPGAITNHPSMTTQPSDTFSSIDKNSFNPVLIEIGLGLSFLILFVMTLYSLVRKIERRKVGTMIIGLIVILIIFKLIQEIQPINHDSIVDQRIELSVNTTIDPEIVPIETPPSILFWLVVISLTFLTLGVLLFIISKVVQKPQQVNSYVEEANTALQAIYGGKDLGNIIINCYEQFIRLIKEEY